LIFFHPRLRLISKAISKKKGEKIMARYLVLWEVDNSRLPVDPKERATGWKALMDLVKKDIEDGVSKDWGLFVGENRGYAIFEANEVEIGIRLQQYVPFIIFKTYPIAGVSKVEKVHKAMLN
jgi:hypothetical protein